MNVQHILPVKFLRSLPQMNGSLIFPNPFPFQIPTKPTPKPNNSLILLLNIGIANKLGSMHYLSKTQNKKHTWLFFFDKTYNAAKFPSWFKLWSDYLGSTTEILKPSVLNSFNLFKSQYKPIEAKKRFPLLCLFCSKFFLP